MTLHKTLQVKLDFKDKPVGAWVFIPTLTPELYHEDVLEAAKETGYGFQVYPGIHKNFYGLFCVRVK